MTAALSLAPIALVPSCCGVPAAKFINLRPWLGIGLISECPKCWGTHTVALSYDVQEDDLARENRLSSKCWSCQLEKGFGHYAGCVAYDDPNANLSDEQLAVVQGRS